MSFVRRSIALAMALSAAALLLAGAPGPAAAQAAAAETSQATQGPGNGHVAATAASLVNGDERTRFVMELSAKVPFHVFALADPYRVIVDLPQVAFHLEAGEGQDGEGLVSAFRYGLLAVGRSRVVLDVMGPVAVREAKVEEAGEGHPARLVVELEPTDREAFMDRYVSSGKADARAAEPRQTAAAVPVLRPQVPGRPVVVIDPGHGGIDPGAVSRRGVTEKEIVLAFGVALRDALRENGCCIVHMTRERDIFLALRERVAFARGKGASLFVSLHADQFRGGDVSGATVYTLSERASDAEAAALAQSENKADLIAGLDLDEEPDEVTDILIDLAQRETKNFSVQFARLLVRTMAGDIRMNKNPHRFAGFAVLRAPDVPSVLLELGYLSNSADVTRLQDAEWRARAAAAVARAIAGYFKDGQ